MKSFDDIPPLAFGHDRSLEYADPERMSEALARGTTVAMNYRSAEPDGSFVARSAVIQTRSVKLIASASSALTVEAHGASKGILMVALHGSASTRRGSRTIEWGNGGGALYLPPGGCSTQSTRRSVLAMDIDPVALDQVTQVMLGGRVPKPGRTFDFATPSSVNLRGNNVDFGSIIQSAAATVGLFGTDARLVEKTGLDDSILRTVALLLNFDELSASEVETGPTRAIVQMACEYIDANLTNAITLTDLEAVTGLSRRSLQYAFRAAFDCTPMQWVAQRRLEAVRSHILAARQGTTLTAIVGEYFANLGEFARMYKQRYGELPSATLKNAISRRLRS